MDVSEAACTNHQGLRAIGYDVVVPKSVGCGALHVHSGDRITARELQKPTDKLRRAQL